MSASAMPMTSVAITVSTVKRVDVQSERQKSASASTVL